MIVKENNDALLAPYANKGMEAALRMDEAFLTNGYMTPLFYDFSRDDIDVEVFYGKDSALSVRPIILIYIWNKVVTRSKLDDISTADYWSYYVVPSKN